MKQNKFLSMLAVGLLALGFTACSDDNDLPNGGEQEGKQAQAYFQLSVASGNNAAMTKSGNAEDSGETDAGTSDENAVKNATAYFFKKGTDAPGDFVFKHKFSTFTNETNGSTYTSSVEKVKDGEFFVCVLVNHELPSTITNITYDVLKDHTFSLTNGYIASSDIPMSSRVTDGAIWGAITITEANTENNPAKLELAVERSYAKVEVSASTVSTTEGTTTTTTVNNTLPVYKDGVVDANNKIADVILKQFKLNNLPTSYYAFRHVANYTESNTEGATGTWGSRSFGKIDTNNPYVYEPTTESKFAATNSATLGASDYVTMPATLDAPASLYCLENTMPASKQKKGYVTSVVFKTQVDPVKYWEVETAATSTASAQVKETTVTETTTIPSTIYYYNDEFFASLEALNAHCEMTVTEDVNNPALLTSYGIYKYSGTDEAPRVCYYHYFIKHVDNTPTAGSGEEDTMGVMEYAIVRNNYYKLSVSSVKLPGDPNEDNYSDDEDVELKEAYIQVALSVNPWIVRSQSAVLGPQ